MKCPYCQHELTDDDARSIRGQFAVSKRKDRQPVNAVATKTIPLPDLARRPARVVIEKRSALGPTEHLADSVRIDKGYDFGA